jgi:hypothetical protein
MNKEPKIDKRVRLERLADLTKNVPRTFWSRAEFVAEGANASDALWFIRTRATNAESQSAMTSEQVLAYLACSGSDLVIQEFITSRFSGVTFVAAPGLLSEALPGKCDGILRGGARGVRWASSKSGAIYWITGDAISSSLVEAISFLQAEQLQLLRQDLTGHMLEWVIKNDGGYLWVDLKYLSLNYLSDFGPQCPRWYEIGDPAREPEHKRLVLADTRLSNDAILRDDQRCELVCQSGSPLAHLCVAAYEAGFSVFVPETG